MIYPIIPFGHPILRKRAEDISQDYPELDRLIEDMYETMYNAKGVGIAAPQIGKSIRLFIVDGSPIEDDTLDMRTFKKVFINPVVLAEDGDEWGYDEGCLSIPDVIEEVYRQEEVRIRYFDRNWQPHEETYFLFTDHLGGFRKQLIKSRLKRISEGKYATFYPMAQPAKK
jgi:peptide deformylase